MNRYFILPLLPAMLLGAYSREVNVQGVCPFEVELMPYHQEATKGQAVEMRCRLAPQKLLVARKYYVRKFQRSGKGSLLLNVGGVELTDSDNYDLTIGDFRLYCTLEADGQHTIELVVSDDADQEQSLLLEFKLSEQSGGDNTPSPDNSQIPPIGDVAQGESGSYYVNGADTGIAIKPNHKPVVAVIDGYCYIDGVKIPVPAPSAPATPQYPNGVLMLALRKQGKYEVLLISKSPEVTYTGPTTNEKRKVVANGVRIEDGACLYQCLSPDSVPVPSTTTNGLPRISDERYQTDKNGCFVVPASDLLIRGKPETGVTKSIVVNGRQFSSDNTTYVPSRMVVKLIYSHYKGSALYFRLTQWDSEGAGGKFVPLVTPLDRAVYDNPQSFILWATRDRAKGIGVKADYATLKRSIARGTSDGFIVVILPNVSISDPSLPDYERKDRKPLLLMPGMTRSPYSDRPIRTL